MFGVRLYSQAHFCLRQVYLGQPTQHSLKQLSFKFHSVKIKFLIRKIGLDLNTHCYLFVGKLQRSKQYSKVSGMQQCSRYHKLNYTQLILFFIPVENFINLNAKL